ncbi:hypothetical protein FMUND_15121 [Fusarium mundagurra]|uniref:Uncharacterized protein n=1 Tax=Fusarium mundagurra TaxID=1567541 RepID=A0A8H6D0A5_9HYPO|nr:hypothetical protein FMUND_15121 [Fusarium mundagurra]
MCTVCSSNGPNSIAGILIKDYHQRHRTGERFRLFLCDDLRAKLLVVLCARSYVVDDPALKNFDSDSRFDGIFSDMGLVERYKHGFENVLRCKLASEARWLLRKVHSWEPFIPITINGTPRYMWNTNVVMANLTTFDCARDWIQGNRMSDKESKRLDEEKRAGQSDERAARTMQEMSIDERFSLLDLTFYSEIFCNEVACKPAVSETIRQTDGSEAGTDFNLDHLDHDKMAQLIEDMQNHMMGDIHML